MTKRPGPPPFAEASVRAVFDGYDPEVRARLEKVRSLVFETAAETDGVGCLEETLKWGQPSYLTPETGSGTTIRLDGVKGEAGKVALYVHCQTNLVERFRSEYPDAARYDGNRAVVLDVSGPLPEAPLRHMVAMALTYHLRKRAGA